jgi:hypothetical protein
MKEKHILLCFIVFLLINFFFSLLALPPLHLIFFLKTQIFSQIFFSGNTPLHTAYHTTHNDIAQLLIASRADQKKTNTSGLTPAQLGK